MKCHKSICYALSINNEFSNTNMVILSTRHYSDPCHSATYNLLLTLYGPNIEIGMKI